MLVAERVASAQQFANLGATFWYSHPSKPEVSGARSSRSNPPFDQRGSSDEQKKRHLLLRAFLKESGPDSGGQKDSIATVLLDSQSSAMDRRKRARDRITVGTSDDTTRATRKEPDRVLAALGDEQFFPLSCSCSKRPPVAKSGGWGAEFHYLQSATAVVAVAVGVVPWLFLSSTGSSLLRAFGGRIVFLSSTNEIDRSYL